MKTVIKTVCCDCGKDLGEKDGHGVEGTSHGLYLECAERRLRELVAERIRGEEALEKEGEG